MGLGILFMLAALALTTYNVGDEKKAKQASEEVAMQLSEKIDENVKSQDNEVELYKTYPEIELPIEVLNGKEYIGLLDFPDYGLQLPVINNWSYPNLRIAPCRYDGSPYSGDFIIAAHNYKSHFSILKTLKPGDIVRFMDIDGNLFVYEMLATEVLEKTDVEIMKSGEWDMTLFTCTYGGRTRVTVRFVQIDSVKK